MLMLDILLMDTVRSPRLCRTRLIDTVTGISMLHESGTGVSNSSYLEDIPSIKSMIGSSNIWIRPSNATLDAR